METLPSDWIVLVKHAPADGEPAVGWVQVGNVTAATRREALVAVDARNKYSVGDEISLVPLRSWQPKKVAVERVETRRFV